MDKAGGPSKSSEDNVEDLIEELTTSGRRELDGDTLKKLKKACKTSDTTVSHVYNLLMHQLEKQHAEIRYSTFQIIHELFLRSHLFRTLTEANLQVLLVLAVETDPQYQPLPDPQSVARQLKVFALQAIEEWHRKYGKFYRKLDVGFRFLKNVKKVDFDGMRTQLALCAQKAEEKRCKDEKLRLLTLENADQQIRDCFEDIMSLAKQLESCFDLLMPKQEVNDGSAADSLSGNVTTEYGTGILSRTYHLTIELSSGPLVIKEDNDNTDIIRNMTEACQQIRKHFLPLTCGWVDCLLKNRGERDVIDKALGLKNMLKSLLEKYADIYIDFLSGKSKVRLVADDIGSSDEDTEDGFIDVPERTLIHEDVDPEGCSQVSKRDVLDRPGPSSGLGTSVDVPPTVAFGPDLVYWEKHRIDVPSMKSESQHSFWKTNEYEETFASPDIESALRCRVIPFEGKFEPVTRECRARLPNGGLCPRMDRFKCPFHGRVVPRDALGRAVDEQLAEKETRQLVQKEEALRLSVARDMKGALGSNVSERKRQRDMRKSAVSKRRYARLTKLSSVNENSLRRRLERKVLNRRALDRLNSQLNALLNRKHMEKFGSNFNYQCS